MNERAGFTAMTDGNADDWRIISSHFIPFAANGDAAFSIT